MPVSIAPVNDFFSLCLPAVRPSATGTYGDRAVSTYAQPGNYGNYGEVGITVALVSGGHGSVLPGGYGQSAYGESAYGESAYGQPEAELEWVCEGLDAEAYSQCIEELDVIQTDGPEEVRPSLVPLCLNLEWQIGYCRSA
jgi:hypothetical protein